MPCWPCARVYTTFRQVTRTSLSTLLRIGCMVGQHDLSIAMQMFKRNIDGIARVIPWVGNKGERSKTKTSSIKLSLEARWSPCVEGVILLSSVRLISCSRCDSSSSSCKDRSRSATELIFSMVERYLKVQHQSSSPPTQNKKALATKTSTRNVMPEVGGIAFAMIICTLLQTLKWQNTASGFQEQTPQAPFGIGMS